MAKLLFILIPLSCLPYEIKGTVLFILTEDKIGDKLEIKGTVLFILTEDKIGDKL